jgi:hypothetical protein
MAYLFMGHTVAQLAEALRYNPEGCRLDFRIFYYTVFEPH